MKHKHIRSIELSKPKEENSYYRAFPQQFDELLKLVQECPNGYSAKLNAKGKKREPDVVPQYRALNQWVNAVTASKLSSPFYKTSTKCYWILYDLYDFPKCAGCGESKNFAKTNVHLQSGYPRNCTVRCRQHDPLTLQHRKTTCQHRFGVDNPFQNDSIKLKIMHKKQEKYGDAHFTNPKKIQETIRKRKAEDPGFLDKVQQKKCNACKKSFGYENASQCPSIVAKMRKKYIYEGMMLDSSYEIAYLAWMRSQGKNVQRASKTFVYESNGKKHHYIPDFYLPDEGIYVELKGSQFFKSDDGTMMIPWRKKSWTDEEYALRCQKEEAKHQCMLANNVKIILDTDAELKAAFQYMKETYGRNYAKQFRYNKKKDK